MDLSLPRLTKDAIPHRDSPVKHDVFSMLGLHPRAVDTCKRCLCSYACFISYAIVIIIMIFL